MQVQVWPSHNEKEWGSEIPSIHFFENQTVTYNYFDKGQPIIFWNN